MTPLTPERRAELRATWEGHPLLDWVDALEAALRPFAGDQFEDPSWSNADELVVVEFDGGRLFTLRVGDFRRAASLLPGEGNA